MVEIIAKKMLKFYGGLLEVYNTGNKWNVTASVSRYHNIATKDIKTVKKTLHLL
jgi:hypothetical protein